MFAFFLTPSHDLSPRFQRLSDRDAREFAAGDEMVRGDLGTEPTSVFVASNCIRGNSGRQGQGPHFLYSFGSFLLQGACGGEWSLYWPQQLLGTVVRFASRCDRVERDGAPITATQELPILSVTCVSLQPKRASSFGRNIRNEVEVGNEEMATATKVKSYYSIKLKMQLNLDTQNPDSS